MAQIKVKFFKVVGLPSEPVANALYFIENDDDYEVYVTDENGDGKLYKDAALTALVAEISDALDEHISALASDEDLGHVKVDGVTIAIDEDGIISALVGGAAIADGEGTNNYYAKFYGGELKNAAFEETQTDIIRSTGKKVLLRGAAGAYYVPLLELYTQGYALGTIFQQGEGFQILSGTSDSHAMYFTNYNGAINAFQFYTGYTPAIRQIVKTLNNATVGSKIEGMSGQTADLQRFYRGAGVVARVGAKGEIVSARNDEILLADLADGEFTMFYDAGDNRLYFRGRSGGNLYGTHINLDAV